jgi:hypothetical protein
MKEISGKTQSKIALVAAAGAIIIYALGRLQIGGVSLSGKLKTLSFILGLFSVVMGILSLGNSEPNNDGKKISGVALAIIIPILFGIFFVIFIAFYGASLYK